MKKYYNNPVTCDVKMTMESQILGASPANSPDRVKEGGNTGSAFVF